MQATQATDDRKGRAPREVLPQQGQGRGGTGGTGVRKRKRDPSPRTLARLEIQDAASQQDVAAGLRVYRRCKSEGTVPREPRCDPPGYKVLMHRGDFESSPRILVKSCWSLNLGFWSLNLRVLCTR